jgi:hypothetical protein
MRLLPILLWAVLSFVAFTARAACDEAVGCPEPAQIQVAELPGNVVPALAPHEVATAPARVAAVSDTPPGGALVMRPDAVRPGARASQAERGRADPGPAGSEPSSVWLMLFAGVAFAGFVIAKRIRG